MEKTSSSSPKRKLTDHQVNGLNEAIEIEVLDQPGPGGANHDYRIKILDGDDGEPKNVDIHFQNGPIQEVGIDGLSNESLLAIVIDRLRGFQHKRKEPLTSEAPDGEFDFSSRGRFACRENALALTHIEEGLMWLQKRTNDRMKRGVEGTHKQ